MKTCSTCQQSYPNNYAICPADGTQLTEIGTWSEGSVIRGKYRLLAKVGQGGMGSVYKALHLAFDELRALKVIAPELLTDELFVKRFKHEAVITRRLQHPNAVRVDDIDEAEDGRPYIVMEFIDGKSLKKLIREEGPLPYERVCSIIKQTASALDAAHKLGMVHRDIKPDNIALVDSPDGEMVKVLDFGIAKVKEARMGDNANLTLTGAGVVIGTPQYMSPEQAMGKKGDELDGRADLYSLGVVMYQMLTADLPFKADTTMEMLLAHMQKPPAPINMVHPELQIPEPIADLTLRLLEKNRDKRPASGRALIQEIERLEKDVMTQGRTRVLTADDLVAADNRPATPNRAPTPVTPPPRSATQQVRPPEPPKLPPQPQPPQPPASRQQPVQVVAPPLRPNPRNRAGGCGWPWWFCWWASAAEDCTWPRATTRRKHSPSPCPVPHQTPRRTPRPTRHPRRPRIRRRSRCLIPSLSRRPVPNPARMSTRQIRLPLWWIRRRSPARSTWVTGTWGAASITTPSLLTPTL